MNNPAPLTRNQSLVLHALAEAGAPLSAYGILDQVRPEGIKAPLQVYRALDRLLEQGLVHRLESLNAFVACSHGHCSREATIAFAICDGCGHVSEFSDAVVEDRLAIWSERNGFRLTKTTIEMRGSCASCAAA